MNLWFKGGGVSCPECVVLLDEYSTKMREQKFGSWEKRLLERVTDELSLKFQHVALSAGEFPPKMEPSSRSLSDVEDGEVV